MEDTVSILCLRAQAAGKKEVKKKEYLKDMTPK